MLHVDFINVGDGDAILLREHTDGRTFSMLVDCGDAPKEPLYSKNNCKSAVEYLKSIGVDHLDLLVLTHLHINHIGGLHALLDEVHVAELWTNYLPDQALWERVPRPDAAVGEEVLCALRMYGSALNRMLQSGTRLRMVQCNASVLLTGHLIVDVSCAEPGLYAAQKQFFDSILTNAAPPAEFPADELMNNTSVRLLLHYRGHSVFLPGDISAAYLQQTTNAFSKCDILKVAHHGDADALTDDILHALSPQYAVISVSGSHDCPAQNTLHCLQRQGTQVLVTNAGGTENPPAQCPGAVRFAIEEAVTMLS